MYNQDFADFQGTIWFNTASEGPLPNAAAQALQEAIHWKSKPYLLNFVKFAEVPARLKMGLGRLLNLSPDEIILGNSASYGVHLLANGLMLSPGDDVILMQNDFPTNILPWLDWQNRGVQVRQVRGASAVITAEELEANLTDRTRVVCLSQVHTFSGHRLDVEAVADLCRKRKIWFILNISQSAGAEPVDVTALKVDAVVCAGYKWLLGPYGTGFAWISPELRAHLRLNLNYWTAALSEQELRVEGVLEWKDNLSVRKYDVFATANFFNFVPFTASVEYLLKIGIPAIRAHNQRQIEHFLRGLDRERFCVISREPEAERSNLVVFSHRQADQNSRIHQQLTAAGIHLALWKGNLRLAPHLFNSIEEVNQLLSALDCS